MKVNIMAHTTSVNGENATRDFHVLIIGAGTSQSLLLLEKMPLFGQSMRHIATHSRPVFKTDAFESDESNPVWKKCSSD